MTDKKININVGSGGRQMHEFISEVILKKLGNQILNIMDDSAVVDIKGSKKIAMTSDSYVVSPVFFDGGDIGRLCVCGTVNDLATSGAKAKYLSLSFIIEEGASLIDLEKIVNSIAATAKEAGVLIVTGDTKVVEKGKADVLYINTTGVGLLDDKTKLSTHNAQDNDIVMVTGNIGDHEVALIKARKLVDFDINVKSDVAPLNKKVEELLKITDDVHCIKDPTRGGLAGALNEIASNSICDIKIFEDSVPFSDGVKSVCNLIGFDPMYLASEGKYVIICNPKSELAVKKIFGDKASVIGVIKKSQKGAVLVETSFGGVRKLSVLDSIQLPRIC